MATPGRRGPAGRGRGAERESCDLGRGPSDLNKKTAMNKCKKNMYKVSTKKVHFSFPVRRAKVNFFCGHPVEYFKASTYKIVDLMILIYMEGKFIDLSDLVMRHVPFPLIGL